MPWVTIQWYEGRSIDVKRKTAELVTKAVCEGCGCKPEEVSIVFQDVKLSDWADNGKLNSDT